MLNSFKTSDNLFAHTLMLYLFISFQLGLIFRFDLLNLIRKSLNESFIPIISSGDLEIPVFVLRTRSDD